MNAEKVFYPIVKAAIDVPTVGFGGALLEAFFEVPYEEQRKKKINNFIKNTIKKINELDLKISEKNFKKRIQKPEFLQLFIKILNKIQNENRKKIQQIYSNVLTNLTKEDAQINFNQKIFYLDILDSLNEDHIKMLSTFYKDRTVKNRFPLADLHKKMGCYIRRKRRKGEPASLFEFEGKGDGLITALDPLKGSYFESLLSDLDSKKLIKIETEITSEPNVDEEDGKVTAVDSIDSELSEEYVGTELGLQFYKFIIESN